MPFGRSSDFPLDTLPALHPNAVTHPLPHPDYLFNHLLSTLQLEVFHGREWYHHRANVRAGVQ